jgi:uncharacterized membrane-anchored protein
MTPNLGYTESLVIILGFFFAILISQLKTKKFHPVLYWITIIATTTLGTEISDFMDRTLGLGYMLGSAILFSGLMIVLLTWHYQFKTIIVYPIFDFKSEAFYWTAILFSNSLGTAFGDFLSDNLGMGYLEGALVTSGIIILVVILHYSTNINEILLFWIAFIFTRPFGATFGDLLTKPITMGGLQLGTIPASLITAIIITILIIYSYRVHKATY